MPVSELPAQVAMLSTICWSPCLESAAGSRGAPHPWSVRTLLDHVASQCEAGAETDPGDQAGHRFALCEADSAAESQQTRHRVRRVCSM